MNPIDYLEGVTDCYTFLFSLDEMEEDLDDLIRTHIDYFKNINEKELLERLGYTGEVFLKLIKKYEE